MQTAMKIWKTSDNIIMVQSDILNKSDIQSAFDRLGVGYEIQHKSNRYYDNGLLAVTKADSGECGEIENWLIIAWGTMDEAERNSWLIAGRN
jgi:hypothetical protein